MGCCHHYFAQTEGGDTAFSIDASHLLFGPGVLKEAGDHARALGMKRLALFTDKGVAKLPFMETVTSSLRAAGVDFAVYDEVAVEPTDVSFKAAAKFATEGRFDGFLSLGGGSVMDTCKAANLYATYPADFLAYVNAPIGGGKPVPGPVKPHIACPTTSGTGSEATGIAIFDLLAMKAKTGIQSRLLKPTLRPGRSGRDAHAARRPSSRRAASTRCRMRWNRSPRCRIRSARNPRSRRCVRRRRAPIRGATWSPRRR